MVRQNKHLVRLNRSSLITQPKTLSPLCKGQQAQAREGGQGQGREGHQGREEREERPQEGEGLQQGQAGQAVQEGRRQEVERQLRHSYAKICDKYPKINKCKHFYNITRLQVVHIHEGVIAARKIRLKVKVDSLFQNNNKYGTLGIGRMSSLSSRRHARKVEPEITKPRLFSRKSRRKNRRENSRNSESTNMVIKKYQGSNNPLRVSDEEPEVFFGTLHT